MAEETAARLVNAMRAWEDFEAYPTSDARRFQLAQRIIEDACRRIPTALTLVADDVRGQDPGWFGKSGWGFFLTIAVIDGRVRATIDQLLVEKGLVRGADGGMGDHASGILDSRALLAASLERRVRASQKAGDCRGNGEQWYGELVEQWTGMWRDQTFLVLDEFVNPRRGLLWDNIPNRGEWQSARWAWLAFNNPLRNRIHMATSGKSIETWELPNDDPMKDRFLHRPHATFIGRKWPDSPEQVEYEYDPAELDRAMRILEEGRRHPLEVDPESIPLAALARPEGINIQQRVLHYLLMDSKGPQMTAARIADKLGFSDPRDVRKAAKACQAKMARG